MKPSLIPLAVALSAHAATSTPTPQIVDSSRTFEQATSGNHCEADPRFATVRARQRLVTVHYWGLDEQGVPDRKIHRGQIVVDSSRVEDTQAIFKTAFRSRLPIHSVIPVSEFNWIDASSMDANNSSGWNFRGIGSKKSCPPQSGGSKHAGLTPGTTAIDINPIQNPYCHSGICEPTGSTWDPNKPGTLTSQHPVIKMAVAPRGSEVSVSLCPETETQWSCTPQQTRVTGLGWSWGGTWQSSQDYQHLQVTGQ